MKLCCRVAIIWPIDEKRKYVEVFKKWFLLLSNEEEISHLKTL